MRRDRLPDAEAAGAAAKKKSTHAAERDRPDVVARRAAWPGEVAGYAVADLIFADEFGTHTAMQRTHGRAAPGERVVASAPAGHYKAISTVAALSVGGGGGGGGIVAHDTYVGGTTAARFVAFVRDKLVPVLRPGQVLVLDNLSAHKNPRVDALLEAAGCRVLRLPPYSPDLNPIEKAIFKVKQHLRKLARRTVPDLIAGIAEAVARVTVRDALRMIRFCGYATKRRKPL